MVQRYKCSLQGRMNKFLKPLGTNKTLRFSQESVLVPLFPHPSCPGMSLLRPVLGKLNLPVCVFRSERLEVPFLFQFCPTHLQFCVLLKISRPPSVKALSTAHEYPWFDNLAPFLNERQQREHQEGNVKHGFLYSPKHLHQQFRN